MNLPNGTTLDGYDIKTSATDTNRTYFTPPYLGDSNHYACIGVIGLSGFIGASSKVNYKQQWNIRVRSICSNEEGINAEIIFTLDRINSVDNYLVRVNNYSTKYLDTNKVKAIMLSSNARIYLYLDTPDNLCFVEVTSVIVNDEGICEVDSYKQPFFVADTALTAGVPTGDSNISVIINNPSKIYSYSTLASSMNITNNVETSINFDTIKASNRNFTTTIPLSGVYKIGVSAGLKGTYTSSSDMAILNIKVDGATVITERLDQRLLQGTAFLVFEKFGILNLNKNQVISVTIQLYSNTGSIQVNNTQTFLFVEQVG